jgi:MFS transporter, DHA1 family, multidrug resistance protein
MKNTRFLLLLVLSLVACSIEIDISVPSFPDMAKYFGVSEAWVQLTIAFNFLGFFVSSFLYGPLSDSFGRRKLMIIGNGIMALGAVLCALAPTINLMLFARFIQGIGASTSAVIVFAMIADKYSARQSMKLIVLMNSILTIAVASAPIAGGFINEALGWRGNYAFVAVFSVLSWIMLVLFLPETNKEFEQINVTAFIKNYKKLFSSTSFISSSMVPSLLYCGYLAFVVCSSFLYIETFGISVIEYSMHQAAIVGAFAGTSLFAGRIIEFFGEIKSTIWAIALCVISPLGMLFWNEVAPNSIYLTTITMSLYSIGAAVAYPIIFTSSLEVFPEIKGTASSAIMSMRAVLVSFFVALTSYFYSGQIVSIALVMLVAIVVGLIFTLILYKKDFFRVGIT